MVAALLAYALVVSVGIVAGFAWAGPVPERRALLGLTYAALVAVGWCAALLLGFLSPLALAGAAALLATLGLLAAWFSLADERLLARFDARLDDPGSREAALEEVRARIVDIGAEGQHVVALMEVAGHPVRRLLSRQLFEEALGLLDFIRGELGERLGAVDASEHRLLRCRALLHLGRLEEAERELVAERAAGTKHPDEAATLEALVAILRGDRARAEDQLARAKLGIWAAWTRPLHALAAAHVATARGDEAAALERLRAVPAHARASTFQLARALPGPASALAARLEHPSAPYR